MMKKQWVADGSLLFVAFVWGATFVVVQNAISFLPPLSFNAVRFWLAGIFFARVDIPFSSPVAPVDPSISAHCWRLDGRVAF